MASIAADYTGKTVIVTGAGGNFGKAGALFFAAQGANVVMVDINPDPLAAAAQPV